MRKAISLGAALLLATILFADTTFQPLNVKVGLWQVTGTNKMGNAPQNVAYKKCVTPKELNTDPWVNGPDEKCTWTVLTSTGTDMEVQGSDCEAGKNYGMKTDLRVKLHVVDSENVKASLQGTMSGNGQTVNIDGKLAGKWIGASCPDGTN